MKFEVGAYVRYLNKIWIVEYVSDDIMFIRNVDEDYIAAVREDECDMIDNY